MKYYIDGFTFGGNPGYGGGYTIVNEFGDLIDRKQVFKDNFTNNEGEVLGLKRAIEIAKSGDIISTDSQNNLYWLCSGSSEKRPDLNKELAHSKSMLFDSGITILWERREYNLAGIYNEQEIVTKEDIETSKNAEIEFSKEISRTLERIQAISDGFIVVRHKKTWQINKPIVNITIDSLGLPEVEIIPAKKKAVKKRVRRT